MTVFLLLHAIFLKFVLKVKHRFKDINHFDEFKRLRINEIQLSRTSYIFEINQAILYNAYHITRAMVIYKRKTVSISQTIIICPKDNFGK